MEDDKNPFKRPIGNCSWVRDNMLYLRESMTGYVVEMEDEKAYSS